MKTIIRPITVNKVLFIFVPLISLLVVLFHYVLPSYARTQCASKLEDKSNYTLDREKDVFRYRFFTCLSYYGVKE